MMLKICLIKEENMVNDGKRVGESNYRFKPNASNYYDCTNPIAGAAVDLKEDPEVCKSPPGGLEAEYIDEIQFVIPPPVDIAQLIRFLRQAREILQCDMTKIVGSWADGCAITMRPEKPVLLASIVAKFREISQIELTQDMLLEADRYPQLPNRLAALFEPGDQSNTIYVNFMNN